ncbi:lipopolysaccharide-induced tumor necrosis factor-alpha factor homolog [Hydra vulgaris]|uniref:Lipopolysaccharide-induced tumor necrosis factor-alpha factor homolog n=1 Tax=Hydra vulgaris TaxID=6087 RepID=A0ABM4C182_HYDVU
MNSNEPPKYEESMINSQPPPNYASNYPPPMQPGYYVPPGNVYPPPDQMHTKPMQQPMYPPGPANNIVIQPQVAAAYVIAFNMSPIRMQCPHCQAQIVTSIEYVSGLLAWLLCLGMFFFGAWLCCFIPFCIDGCKDVNHSCPNCMKVIGTFKRM